MSELVQLTYSSVATHPFSHDELLDLLKQFRRHNQASGITGMLLYAEGSFFQVLEGNPETIDKLFTAILRDKRHEQITVIIREPIATRSFGDWTMGYAELTPKEADEILGTNDFFTRGESFAKLRHDRARMLLHAFNEGRWREKLSDSSRHPFSVVHDTTLHPQAYSAQEESRLPTHPAYSRYTFAYQPIVDVSKRRIFSYEALLRGPGQESANYVLSQVPPSEMHKFDEQCRIYAVRLAAKLGLTTHLNLNFLPRSVESSPTVISSLLAEVEQLNIHPDQIVIEILEREIIRDYDSFNDVLNECRGAGVIMAIDDFGSGYAGLNLLAEFQPNLIKLDINLVKEIQKKGPRQAIVRGIHHTCRDLGIDIIAEGVETEAEYRWLLNEGIILFQGNLIALPAFEALPTEFIIPV